MSDDDRIKEVKFGGPAEYRIVVQGPLHKDVSDCLAGMHIVTQYTPVWPTPRTILVGLLRDQAELSGVLNTLYERHLPILSVEIVDSQISEARPGEGRSEIKNEPPFSMTAKGESGE